MKKIFSKVFIFMVFVYLYTPIVVLVSNSFNVDRYGVQWKGFSLRWYEKLFQNDTLIQATINSLVLAVVSASIATILGVMTAIALYRYQFKGKGFMGTMLFITMMSPDIVMAVAMLILFIFLGIELGFVSLVIVHITFCLPYVVITVYSRLADFDGKMLEAAKDLGASEWIILMKIIMPLILPAVISGWVLSFTISLDDVIVSSFVTGPSFEVLPLKLFSMVRTGITPEVNALATMMIVLSLLLLIISQLITRKSAKHQIALN